MKPPRRMRRMRALDGTEWDELLSGQFRRRVGPLDQHPAPKDIVEIERVHGPLFESVVGATRAYNYCPGRCGKPVKHGGKRLMCIGCWPRLPLDIRQTIERSQPNWALLTDLTRALRDARVWFQHNPIPEEARRG